jgi:hypothetical protein
MVYSSQEEQAMSCKGNMFILVLLVLLKKVHKVGEMKAHQHISTLTRPLGCLRGYCGVSTPALLSRY